MNDVSNHRLFPTDLSTLSKFKQKINWTILSQSDAVQQKFNPNSWGNGKEWYTNINRYLQKFEKFRISQKVKFQY